ncbi:MAG: mandelate racemase/muconate lactonizing enzyme family protein [Burkholderiaceae bacterium]
MKITAIQVHVLRHPLPAPFAFSQGWVTHRSATLVEVSTDSGLTGWGEAFAQGLEAPQIAAAAIEHALAPLLLDADPRDVEVHWHAMYHRCRDFGRTGSVIAAISALDIALWDILGKSLGQPIHRLLGGAFRRRVRPYATGFYRLRGPGEAKRLAEEALAHHERGFRTMKIKLGFGVDDDLAVMRAVAEALQGRGCTLMIDTNHAYGRAQALRLGRALADYDLRWYEEPVAPEDIAGYREMRDKLPMPIAGGENAHTMYGFLPLLSAGAIDIAQPDIGSCGGFTAARHIGALAQAHGVAVNPHVWGSAVAQAASLHWLAALPPAHHSLAAQEPILEYDMSDHPFRNALVDTPLRIEHGWVAVSERPGLGIEIDREVLVRYRIGGSA